jgi:predicted alpha/beta-fold hydrolase
MFSRGLDFAPVDATRLKDDTPIIVVTHGLTGGKTQPVAEYIPILIFCGIIVGSYEPYIRAILHRTCAPVEEGGFGYRAVVVNFRGCE